MKEKFNKLLSRSKELSQELFIYIPSLKAEKN